MLSKSDGEDLGSDNVKAIVTIKLKRNINHDPQHKKTGRCPIQNCICTDITGSHHSYIETGENRDEIIGKARKKWGHVTRIEVIND